MNKYPVSFDLHYPTYQQLESFIGLSAWISILSLILFCAIVIFRGTKHTSSAISFFAILLPAGTLLTLIFSFIPGVNTSEKAYIANEVQLFLSPVWFFFALYFTGVLG